MSSSQRLTCLSRKTNLSLPTVVAPLAGVVVTGEPTTVDAWNVIVGSLYPDPCGRVGMAVPSDPDPDPPGTVGLAVDDGVDVVGQGADVETMLNVRVELGV